MRLPSLSLLLALAVQGCQQPSLPGSTTDDPSVLAQSLVTATEQFCVPYIVDGATVDDLMQRSEITAWTQSVHGQDVVRYRFNELPGLLDATLTQSGSCWIGAQEVPPNEIPAVVDAFQTNLHLDGYTTGAAHFVPDASTLVVGEPSEAAERRSHHICVYGRTNALIQMSGYGIVHVDSGRPAEQSCHSN